MPGACLWTKDNIRLFCLHPILWVSHCYSQDTPFIILDRAPSSICNVLTTIINMTCQSVWFQIVLSTIDIFWFFNLYTERTLRTYRLRRSVARMELTFLKNKSEWRLCRVDWWPPAGGCSRWSSSSWRLNPAECNQEWIQYKLVTLTLVYKTLFP